MALAADLPGIHSPANQRSTVNQGAEEYPFLQHTRVGYVRHHRARCSDYAADAVPKLMGS